VGRQARVWRAAVLIGLAAVAVAAVGAHYLAPGLRTASASRPTSVPYFAELPPATLTSMDWRSATTGWVVVPAQSASLVYRTTDAGRHWRQQLVAYGTFTVHFFDARHGMLLPPAGQPVIGQEPVSVSCVTPGRPSASPCPPLEGSVRFVPPQPNGGAHVAIYRTDDGGDHWRPVPLPQAALSGAHVSFADPSHGWLLTTTARGGLQADVALYRTDDGGGRWTELLHAGPGQPAGHGLPAGGVQGPVWFADGRDGWVATATPDGPAAVAVTHDGGAAWRGAVLPAPPGGWRTDAVTRVAQVAASGAGGVLVLAVLPSGDTAAAQVWAYVTSDGGDTWGDPRPVPAPTFRMDASLAFVDGRSGWLVRGGTVALTSDAGRDWRERQGPAGMALSGIAAVSASTAVVEGSPLVGSGGDPSPVRLYATVDGGLSWRRLGGVSGL
jgi:hypothetical protein